MIIDIQLIHYTNEGVHYHNASPEELESFSKSINHHDELVKTLSSFVADERDAFDDDGKCFYCFKERGDLRGHDSDCQFQTAIKLLEKINAK